MFGIFAKKDVVGELDEKISKDEAVYVESLPHHSQYVFYMIQPYLFFEIVLIVVNFLFALLTYNLLSTVPIKIFNLTFFFIHFSLILAIIIKALLYLAESINTYYIITNEGIHRTKGGKTLIYSMISYNDIKSISIKKDKFKNSGTIFIKTTADSIPSSLIGKILYRRDGLISIDQVDDVYAIVKEICTTLNPAVLFTDSKEHLEEIDYFQDVKKYASRFNKVDKNQSLMDKRNK